MNHLTQIFSTLEKRERERDSVTLRPYGVGRKWLITLTKVWVRDSRGQSGDTSRLEILKAIHRHNSAIS